MDAGDIAHLKIEALVLQYNDETKKALSKNKTDYAGEIDFLIANQARLKFIKNLALSLKGNTFVMYRYVEKHGEVLCRMIQESTDRPVYFVSGDVSPEDREVIRKLLEDHDDAIVVCSVGTFAMGVNVKNLHNIILGHPGKDASSFFSLLVEVFDYMRLKST
jgi:superfamily II DNA helicase RecQ